MQPRHLAVAAQNAHSARRPRRTRIQFGSHRFDACAIFRMYHRKRVVQRAGLVFLASVADHIGSGIAEIQQTNAIRHLVERQTARNGVARGSQPIAQSLLLSGFLGKQIEVAEIARAREQTDADTDPTPSSAAAETQLALGVAAIAHRAQNSLMQRGTILVQQLRQQVLAYPLRRVQIIEHAE